EVPLAVAAQQRLVSGWSGHRSPLMRTAPAARSPGRRSCGLSLGPVASSSFPGWSIAVAPAVAAGARAVLARPGLVDGQAATADLLAAEAGDGGLGLLVGAHLHEAEALGAAGVPVHDDLGRLHRAVRLEHLRQVGVGGLVAQVA